MPSTTTTNNRKMPEREQSSHNSKYVCRCCLRSEAEFLRLDTQMVARNLDASNTSGTLDQIPLLSCLIFCIRTERNLELSPYICKECSQSLQIAYYFLQNALRAHEILCRQLAKGKAATSSRANGHIQQGSKPVRHECKICGDVINNRMELKQHIRLHTDAIAHNCTLCKFVTLKQRVMLEHYRVTHALTAAQAEELLKDASNKSTPKKVEEEVKVCTLEDMELLIPTVLTPEDYAQPKMEADQLREIEQQLAVTMSGTDNQNVSIGTEYLVMPDGSLQQLNDGGVVIEYIDDSKPSHNISLQNLLAGDSLEPMDLDINEIIEEEVMLPVKVKPKAPLLKHKCKLCPKTFATLARLKSHQLTHSHLPKFYCDQCGFYSLRSSDLVQHYKTTHHKSMDEALPGEEARPFSCDLCLFETQSSGSLRVHYNEKHQIQPSDIHLRPSWSSEVSTKAKTSTEQPTEMQLGIRYPTIQASATMTINDHQQQQQPPPPPPQATTTATITPSGDISVVVDATALFYAAANENTTNPIQTTTVMDTTDPNHTFAIFPEISVAEPIPTTTTTTNTTMFGDMQDFIDSTDVAAICTIPADDMPVVDGDDIVIDNNNISLDFDAENLFEEFDEEGDDVETVEAEEEDEDDDEEEEDEDDAENEDENDNNDTAADQNLLLTSDDDDVDDFDDEQSKHLQKPYCIFCNKKFTSQYKFENHMFVHRGLAPYRCELCTNLYNMKRLLIRHYKTVHKRMPTRDMVQAKGDKVSVERTNIEKLQLKAINNTMLMCAKCPFECELDAEMRKHLNAHHGINDGVSVHANEVFIIRKLPFECPRCIRSFAAKRTLTRHLQRSHLVDTIIEMQAPVPQATTSSAETTTTTTATTTLPVNIKDLKSASSSDNGECVAASVKAEADNLDVDVGVENVPTPTPSAPTAVVATTSSSSTLFPTPTPFDFDYDFMGDAATTTITPTPTPSGSNNNNNNTNTTDGYAVTTDSSLPSHLLNGSDKLLTTATMDPSPVKDLRSRLPRTPIYICKLCNKTFDELGKLVKHEMEVHSSSESNSLTEQHKCSICNTTCRTPALLEFHMKRHLARKFQCKLCPKAFLKSTELERHTKAKHNNVQAFKCSLDGCRKTFNFKHHMVRHQNASHLKVRHVCSICDKELKSSSRLRNHMGIHRGHIAYKCPKCERSYMQRGSMRHHALQVHHIELSDAELDAIFNPTVINSNDTKVLTRKGVTEKEQRSELTEAVVNILLK